MYQENGPEGIPRNCLRTRNIDPNPTTSPRPQGIPARLNIAAPSRDWISRPAAMGFMRMIPTNRQAGTFPLSSVRFYTLSIPTWTTETFTNSVKEKLRYTIADALSRPPIQLSISPDNVLIDSVIDVPQNFLPLPTGARAGVQIQFTLDCPDTATADAITATLQSNAIGSLGGQAGAIFATYGMVPFLQQREVVFRQIFPQGPQPANNGGAIAGGVIVVLLLGAGGLWAYKKGLVDFSNLPFVNKRAPRRDAARKTMGGVVEDLGGPSTRRYSAAPIAVSNPVAFAAPGAPAPPAYAPPTAVYVAAPPPPGLGPPPSGEPTPLVTVPQSVIANPYAAMPAGAPEGRSYSSLIEARVAAMSAQSPARTAPAAEAASAPLAEVGPVGWGGYAPPPP
jgi:hypothetical protein